jgi:hypothetical protein
MFLLWSLVANHVLEVTICLCNSTLPHTPNSKEHSQLLTQIQKIVATIHYANLIETLF